MKNDFSVLHNNDTQKTHKNQQEVSMFYENKRKKLNLL